MPIDAEALAQWEAQLAAGQWLPREDSLALIQEVREATRQLDEAEASHRRLAATARDLKARVAELEYRVEPAPVDLVEVRRQANIRRYGTDFDHPEVIAHTARFAALQARAAELEQEVERVKVVGAGRIINQDLEIARLKARVAELEQEVDVWINRWNSIP